MGANITALVLNHQRMPVYYETCTPDLLYDMDNLHTCFTPKTRVRILCDWIRISHPDPFDPDVQKYVSIGDILQDFYDLTLLPFLFTWACLMLQEFRNRRGDTDGHEICL